jgi:hypothetical protein
MWMIISPRDASDRRRQAAGLAAAGGDAAGSDEAANRLDPDEWDFLRATPDFDAEEMASVTVSGPEYAAPLRWNGGPGGAPLRSESLDVPAGDFPEVGALAELLGDLIDKRGGPGGGSAVEAWAGVPAGAEWASLMEPHPSPKREARASGRAPAAPAVRDVLLDALAAGERVGLLPESEQD